MTWTHQDTLAAAELVERVSTGITITQQTPIPYRPDDLVEVTEQVAAALGLQPGTFRIIHTVEGGGL